MVLKVVTGKILRTLELRVVSDGSRFPIRGSRRTPSAMGATQRLLWPRAALGQIVKERKLSYR